MPTPATATAASPADILKAVDGVNQLTGEFHTLHSEYEAVKRDNAEYQKKFQDLGARIVEQEGAIKMLRAANENASLAIQKLARAPRLGADGEPILKGTTKGYVESEDEHKAFDAFLRKGEQALSLQERDLLYGMQKKALSSDLDPSGGYLTAPTMEAGIMHRLLQVTPIRQYARVSTVGTGSLRIIRRSTQRFTISDVSQREAVIRNAENTPRNTYQALEIPIYESTAEPGVTLTMLEDSLYDLEAEIGADAELDFAVWEGQRFVFGGQGGAPNEPQGFLTASDQNGGEVPTVPSGLATDISMDSLIACFYSLPTPYAANAVATFSRLTAGYLMQLKDAIGNYLWQPSTREGAPSLLAGYRWFESFAMPGPTGFGAGTFATGAAVVAFADWQRAYRIVDRRGIRIIRDMVTQHPNVVFKMSKRIGAQVVLGEAMRILRVGVS